jgi:hypothetical protein
MPNFSIHLPPDLKIKADSISNRFVDVSRSQIFTIMLKHLDQAYIEDVIASYGHKRKHEEIQAQAQ